MKESYNAFVASCSHRMMYHTWIYKDFIKELLDVEEHYLCAVNTDGQIQGVLPMLYKNGPLGAVYNSLPFYGSNGGILTTDKEVFDFVVKEYNQFVNKNSLCSSTVISNPLKPEDDYSDLTQNYIDYRIGQFSEIHFTENHAGQLMNMFHYKTRNMIRKAIKEEVKVEIDNSAIDFLYETHHENMIAIGGKPKSKKFFYLLNKYYQSGKDYRIYTAHLNGDTISALLLFYAGEAVEYYTPVIVEKYRDKQALSLIIYTAMIDASINGYKHWNWGGTWTTQQGVYTFKKRWGTKDIKYYYYTKIKNQNVLKETKEYLLKYYDNLFVVAFDKLIG